MYKVIGFLVGLFITQSVSSEVILIRDATDEETGYTTYGSAVYVGNHLFVTANHVVDSVDKTYYNYRGIKRKLDVIKRDADNDLALLCGVDTGLKASIPLKKAPELGYGKALGFLDFQSHYSEGRFVKISGLVENKTRLNYFGSIYIGQSGGALYYQKLTTNRWFLVGIISAFYLTEKSCRYSSSSIIPIGYVNALLEDANCL